MSKQLDQFKVYSDTKLKLKYELLKKLGEGCFGTVYKAINRTMRRQVALKLEYQDFTEDPSTIRSNISNEIAILQRLKGVAGVPKFYSAGKWSYGYYMEIELLSSSLQDEKNKQFTESEICLMTSELIQILRLIHDKGIIHQDLKPQNIMRNELGSFVIIDYGLSFLTTLQKGERFAKKRGFVGTPRYASLAAHSGLAQKPKDDIQSLLYVMATLYLKKAPWFELKVPASKRLEKIKKYKQDHALGWMKKCGQPFASAYEYLRGLSFDSQINYGYIISLFQSVRKTKAHQTMKVGNPTLKDGSRRKSDSNYQKQNVPAITVHLVNSIVKRRKSSLKGDNEDGSRSHNNFSILAQDGYLQILQFLTQKILSSHELITQQSAMISQLYSKQPIINSMAKYEALHFKNPFQVL